MNKDPSTLIHAYKRRQQTGPFILWGAVTLLVIAGLVLLIVWLMKPNSPMMSLFATQTPTSTITPSPTNTFTPTLTPTETPTATITPSPTASAPFKYTVQDGDSLTVIAQKYNLGDNGIQLLMLLNPYNEKDGTGVDPTTQIVYPGLVITVPNPDMKLPTATPIPSNLPRGTEIIYTIEPGDTLEGIASKFNSTIEDIQKANNIAKPNAIQVGQQIKVHANLVTPTPAKAPTITPGPSPTAPSPYTSTPDANAPTPTPSVTVTP